MKRTVITGIVAGIIGLGVGASAAKPEPVATPTPRIIVETAQPVAQPTPRVVTETVEVEVTPDACYTAILDGYTVMEQNLGTISAILNAYVDYPDENLADFGRRVEQIISDLGDASDVTAAFDKWEDSASECAPL